MKPAILALLLAVCAATAAAQDPDFSIAPTEICLRGAETPARRLLCIGASAARCMETSMGGSTLGQGVCISHELDYWDARLNETYRALRASEQQTDRDMEGDRGAPSRADALRDMQRAWIAFRDATCDYERSQWGSGSGGGPAQAGCLMRMTGQQALYLESMMETW